MAAGETVTIPAAAPTLQELEMDPTQRTIGEPDREPVQETASSDTYAQAGAAEATGSAGTESDAVTVVEPVATGSTESAADADTEGSTVVEPPRSGPGSGRDVWAAYAQSIGVVFEDGATREDIITAVDRAKA